jgi:hypothetical protein
MSKPAPGAYRIVNRVLSTVGQRLAITFNGDGKAATVTSLSDSKAQIVRVFCRFPRLIFRNDLPKWLLKDYDSKTQSVVPTEADNLQAAWGSGFVTVFPAGGYVWTIRETSDGVTYDSSLTFFKNLN